MLNLKFFIIFQLFCFYFVLSQCKLEEFYRWKQITFEGIPSNTEDDEKLMPPEQSPHIQSHFGTTKPFYYQYNNVLKSAAHYKGKFLITIARRAAGIPSTLNYVPDDLPVGSSPSLRPYPDFKTNEVHPELKPDENRIVSVYRTRIDACDRLWFVDTGTLQDHEGGYTKLIQRPSLWLIDLKTDKKIRRFEIPETLVKIGHGMISIQVDVDKGKCDEAYAYISDYLKQKIYVYSYKTNRMWPVSHVYLNNEKKFGIYKVDGVEFEWFDGIFSVALGRRSTYTGYRKAYFHPLSSNSEFEVNTKILQNETLSQNPDLIQSHWFHNHHYLDSDQTEQNLVLRIANTSVCFCGPARLKQRCPHWKIGNRGKLGHSLMHDFDDKTSVIFFAMLTRNAIICWNSNTKYLAENQGSIIENDDRFKYPVDLNIDPDGTLWTVTNNFVRFSYGQLDTNDYNYRLWRGNTKQLIKGTVCEPKKFAHVDKVEDGGPR